MGKMESLKENERNALLELKKIIKFKDKDFENTDSGHVYELNLSKKKLESIPETINELTYLMKLDLQNNKITKIENLDKLVNLTELNLGENKIEKIEGLENLIELKDLNLAINKLSKIEGLKNLIKLTRLSFSSNQITKIEGLEGLSSLEFLSFVINKITKLEGLDDLESLTALLLDPKHLENEDKNIYKTGLQAIKAKFVHPQKKIPVEPKVTPPVKTRPKKPLTPEEQWYLDGKEILDLEEAMAYFKEGLNRSKEYHTYAHTGMGDITCGEYCEFEKAKVHFQDAIKALAIDQDNKHAWVGGGEVWYELGEFNTAITWYRASFDSDPSNPHPYAWYGIGLAYERLKEFQLAINALGKQVEFYPEGNLVESAFAAIERLRVKQKEPPRQEEAQRQKAVQRQQKEYQNQKQKKKKKKEPLVACNPSGACQPQHCGPSSGGMCFPGKGGCNPNYD